VRAIGVSNYNESHLTELLESSIPPMVNQIEIHPCLPQTNLVQFCKQHRIAVQSYSPLGEGRYVNGQLELPNSVFDMATRLNSSIAQLLLSWSLHRGFSVVCKASSESRLLENFNSTLVHLEQEVKKKKSNRFSLKKLHICYML